MKKFIFILVAVALYLHFYPDSDFARWYQEKKENAVEQFSSLSSTKVNISTSKVYNDISAHFDSFSKEERAYVKEITSSARKLKKFHLSHCKNAENNSQLHRHNQETICKALKPYRSLL